jgi:hypothetical protein
MCQRDRNRYIGWPDTFAGNEFAKLDWVLGCLVSDVGTQLNGMDYRGLIAAQMRGINLFIRNLFIRNLFIRNLAVLSSVVMIFV